MSATAREARLLAATAPDAFAPITARSAAWDAAAEQLARDHAEFRARLEKANV